MKAEIGIIGGTGLYDPKLLTKVREIKMRTPYGLPSDSITIGELKGRKVAFLPRHSKKHTIRPTDVNSRANIFAFKKLGVQRILAPSTVGSLREEFKPGDIVLIDQFIDRTTRREESFYTGKKVCHISVAEPMCPELRSVLIKAADNIDINVHEAGTYVCIEGPRFSTKAESRMYRSWGADVVGMTLVPECVLAREAEICYATIAAVTDYDVWKEETVSVEKVVKTMRANVEKVKRLIAEAVGGIPTERECVLAREAEICYATIAAVTDYDVWKEEPVSVDKVVKTMRANVEKVKRLIAEAVGGIPTERECECKSALRNALV